MPVLGRFLLKAELHVFHIELARIAQYTIIQLAVFGFVIRMVELEFQRLPRSFL